MQFDYNDPIITRRRKGTSDDPFVNLNETHVVENGKVILTEIPDPFTKVIVTGANKQWYEIQSGIPNENQYIVDYKNKIVTFNTVNNGLQLNFSYKGTGLTYVPTTMIYTKQNNGEIVETLQQLIDSTEQSRDNANEAADNLIHLGEYDNTIQYKKRNIVTYQGSAYMAIADTQGNLPTDENYWKKLTAFSWKGIYDSAVTYNTGDFVQDANQRNLYLSLIDSNTGNPLTDTIKWKKLITIDDIVDTANQAIADVNTATINANNAANSANTEAANAQNKANYAQTQGDYAKSQGDYAKAQGDVANLAASNANDAATNANNAATNATNAANEAITQATYAQTQGDYAKSQGDYAANEASNLSQLKIDVTNATQLANDAADNANTQATYAQQQGDYAKEQGDYAKQVGDENKTRWLNPVATFADIATTYPNPQHGDTVMVTDDGENSGSVYRYENGQWNLTQKHNDLAIADVQNKIGILNKKIESIVSVKEFGAKGDGETIDTSAIQTAIDTMSSLGGGTVFLPVGIYRVKNLQLKSNVRLVGSGKGTVLKLTNDAAEFDHVLICGGSSSLACNHAGVFDLKIDGNRTTLETIMGSTAEAQMHGIKIASYVNDLRISNVWFDNSRGDGIWCTRHGFFTKNDYPTHIMIDNCYFSNIRRQDIAIIHGYDITITDCHGTGTLDIEPEINQGETPDVCRRISIKGGSFNLISITNKGDMNSQFTLSGAVSKTDISIWDLGGVSVIGNTAKSILLNGVKGATIQGNTCKAIWAKTSDNSNLTISGNIIRNTKDADDPQITTSGATVKLDKTSNSVVVNNVIVSPSLVGIKVDASCVNVKIENNDITDNEATDSTSSGVLVVSYSSVQNIEISKNRISGFYKGILSGGSSNIAGGKVQDNVVECRHRNLELKNWDSVNVVTNLLKGNATNYFYSCPKISVERNFLRNTADTTKILEFSTCDEAVLINNFIWKSGASATIALYNCPNAYIEGKAASASALSLTGTTTRKNDLVSL